MTSLLALMLDVVVPIFLVIGVGVAIALRFDIAIAALNRLAIYAAVPALAFRTLADLDPSHVSIGRLLLGYALLLVLATTAAAVVGWRRAPLGRLSLIGTTVLGNAANMNLPIALFAFGTAGLERALVLYVANALVTYTLGPSLVGRPKSLGAGLGTALRFPVLWAAVAGIAANAVDVTLPSAITRAVDLLANAAIPMVLVTLGVQLVRAHHWRPSRAAVTGVLLKLVVGPLLAAAAGLSVGLAGLDLAVLIVLGSMPTAINALMLAVEFGGDVDQVGDTVLWGTALSVVTLPVVLALVHRLI